MNKKYYFVTDIDGTLITNGEPLGTVSKLKLKRITEQGVKIVFATGRSFEKLKYIIGDVDFHYFSICCNGAEIYDEFGKRIFCATLQWDIQKEILDYLDKKDALYLVYTVDKIYVKKLNDKNIRLLKLGETIEGNFIEIVNEALIYNKLIYENNEEKEDLSTLRKAATKIEIIDSNLHFLSELKKYIDMNNKVTVQSSFKFNIEIAPININKGVALKHLINSSESFVISAGDGMNDIAMFEVSDYTIAMNQAVDCLKKKATYVLTKDDDLLDIVGRVMNILKENVFYEQ